MQKGKAIRDHFTQATYMRPPRKPTGLTHSHDIKYSKKTKGFFALTVTGGAKGSFSWNFSSQKASEVVLGQAKANSNKFPKQDGTQPRVLTSSRIKQLIYSPYHWCQILPSCPERQSHIQAVKNRLPASPASQWGEYGEDARSNFHGNMDKYRPQKRCWCPPIEKPCATTTY